MMKSGLNERIYLVLDIGTSDIKCGCVDSDYTILAQHQRKFPMEQKQRAFEIDFNHFFNTTNDLIKECLADQNLRCQKIEALLITSQAQTFAPVDGDYVPINKGIVWLDERAEKEAVADLVELSQINAKRPYFLLMHVRQWSDITRVKNILDQLPSEFELVPLDIFMKMAGHTPTFLTRYGEPLQ